MVGKHRADWLTLEGSLVAEQPTRDQHVVVVGSSLAGVRGTESLRRAGFTGQITLVGAETHYPPYDRPPLSKQILAGSWEAGAGRLRLDEGVGVDRLLGRTATGLDLVRRVVRVEDAQLPYDGLIVATGATPRNPWADTWSPARGVHVLRTIEDSLTLRDQLRSAARVAVVGAGFIGCEVAGTCRALGLEVTVVDTLPWPMMRAIGPEMGQVLAAFHRSRGVRMELGRRVVGPVGSDRVTGVLLDGDEVIDADVVVIAIGAVPETGWLEGSGLELADGVVCDAECFAIGTDSVVAAGDVARWAHPMLGELVRVEHWTNAVTQAELAARNLAARLAGGPAAEQYTAVPYFWSDQHDWKVQFVGFAAGGEVTIAEGTPDSGRFVAAYHRAGQLTGALCVNWPGRMPSYRRRIVAESAESRV